MGSTEQDYQPEGRAASHRTWNREVQGGEEKGFDQTFMDEEEREEKGEEEEEEEEEEN